MKVCQRTLKVSRTHFSRKSAFQYTHQPEIQSSSSRRSPIPFTAHGASHLLPVSSKFWPEPQSPSSTYSPHRQSHHSPAPSPRASSKQYKNMQVFEVLTISCKYCTFRNLAKMPKKPAQLQELKPNTCNSNSDF